MGGIFGLLITTVLGIIVSFLLGGVYRRVERIGMGVLFGFGFQTFFMFVFYVLGFRFTLPNILFECATLILLLFLLVLVFKHSRAGFLYFIDFKNSSSILTRIKISFANSSGFTKLIWVLILLLVLSSLLIGVYFPVYGWDSLVLYDFRAKTFVATGGMEDGISRGYFFGYPLMTSLAHTWFYFLQSSPHLFYWGIYVGFLIISYFCLNAYLEKTVLLLSLFVLTSLSSFYSGSYFDYTNFPYNVYLIAGILYAAKYLKVKNISYLIVAMIFTGFSTWVRQTEPFWIVNVLAIALLMFMHNKRNIFSAIFWVIGSIGVFFLIQQPWRLFEARSVSGTNISDQAGYAFRSIQFLNWNQLLDVIITTTEKTVPTWQPYLIVAIFTSLFIKERIKSAWIFLYFIIANISLLYFGTYIFSIIWQENWKDIVSSQQRLSSYISPLLIMYTIIISNDHILNGLKIFRWALDNIKRKTFG